MELNATRPADPLRFLGDFSCAARPATTRRRRRRRRRRTRERARKRERREETTRCIGVTKPFARLPDRRRPRPSSLPRDAKDYMIQKSYVDTEATAIRKRTHSYTSRSYVTPSRRRRSLFFLLLHPHSSRRHSAKRTGVSRWSFRRVTPTKARIRTFDTHYGRNKPTKKNRDRDGARTRDFEIALLGVTHDSPSILP